MTADTSKDEVMSVVKKHLVDSVEGLNPEAIDPSLSMRDLGADSLDMVEVVSASMRELKVKVPRTELSKLDNIGALVDLLYAATRSN